MLYCVFALVEIDQSGQSFNDFLSLIDWNPLWSYPNLGFTYFKKQNIVECIPSANW